MFFLMYNESKNRPYVQDTIGLIKATKAYIKEKAQVEGEKAGLAER